MKTFSFPVVKGKVWHFPTKALCPVCRKHKVLEPHSMAILSTGAMLMDRKKDEGGPSPGMDGFLYFCWHGAHDKGTGEDRDIGATVEVVRDVQGGQAELYFCSTECLRQFLNVCVDKLEEQIKRQKKVLQPAAAHRRGKPRA